MNTSEEETGIQVIEVSFNSFFKRGNKITLNYSIDDDIVIHTVDISMINNIRTCNIDHHIFIYGMMLFKLLKQQQ